MNKEAKVEFRTAEAMAPDDPTKLSIHTERVRLGLIKTVSVSVIAKGKLTNYVKELPDKD